MKPKTSKRYRIHWWHRMLALLLCVSISFVLAPASLAESGFALNYSVSEYDVETQSVTVTLTAVNAADGDVNIHDSDGTSVLDEPRGKTATVVITANGSYEFFAADIQGNTANCTVAVDSIPEPDPLPAPPVPEVSITGEMQHTYYKTSCTVSAGYSVAPENPVTLYYVLDEGARALYTEPFVVGDGGTHTVIFYVINTEGAETASERKTFTVRSSWPQIAVDQEASYAVRQGGSLQVSFDVFNMPSASVTAESDNEAILLNSALNIERGENSRYVLTISPSATNALGVCAVSLTATDGDETISTTVDINVTLTEAPTVSSSEPVFHIKHDGSLSYDLTDITSDPLGLPLNYSITGEPDRGAAGIVGSVLSYSPDEGATTDTIDITVSNGVKSSSFTIAVYVYMPPVSEEAVAITIPEDTIKEIDLADYASDPLGHPLNFGLSGTGATPHGAISLSGSALTYTPNTDYFGSDSFAVTVENEVYSETITFNITVTPVGDPPVAKDDRIFVASNGYVLIDALANDEAVDGGVGLEIVEITDLPEKSAACRIENNQIYYKPDPRASGADTLTYSVRHVDGDETATAVVTINIVTVNDLQKIVPVESQITIDEDNELTFRFDVVDIDSVDFESDFSILLSSNNTNVFSLEDEGDYDITSEQIDGDTRRYTVTLWPIQHANTTEYGAASIVVTVTDLNNNELVATATQSVIITPVNDQPVISGFPPETITIHEDGSYTLVFAVTDPDIADPLAGFDVTVTSSDETTLLNSNVVQLGKITLDNRTAQFTYLLSPAANRFNEDGFHITILVKDDGIGADQKSHEVTFPLVVNAVNDLPVANDDYYDDLQEDMPRQLLVLENDTDADGHETITIADVSQSSIGATVEISVDGRSILYTPPPNYYGDEEVFTYTIRDEAGVERTATVRLVIGSVNDLPVISVDVADDPSETDEDTPIAITVGVSDVETQANALMMSLVVTGDPRGVVSEAYVQTVSDPDTRTVYFVPANDKNGTVTIRLLLNDGENTSEKVITVIVNAVNDAPVARDNNYSFNEGKVSHPPIEILISELLANDTDVDTATNDDTISFDKLQLEQPAHGTIELVEIDGVPTKILYTPELNSEANDSFTYGIRDAGGLTSTARVNLTCIPYNDQPMLADLGADIISEDASVTITLDYSDYETSKENLLISIGSSDATIVNPDGLVLSRATSELTITPIANRNGEVTITVTVSDGLKMVSKDFSLTILSEPDPPVAEDDEYDAIAGRAIVLSPLNNDYDVDMDDVNSIESFAIVSFRRITQNDAVTLILNSDNTFNFLTPTGYEGDFQFEYTVEDTDGKQDTATATVHVTAYGAGPMILPQTAIITSAGSAAIDLDLVLRNVPGPKTYTLIATSGDTSLLPNSNLSIGGSGGSNEASELAGATQRFYITPPAKASGSTVITVTLVYDNKTDTIIIPISITRDNAAPVAVPDNFYLDEGQSDTLYVLENDTDDQQPKRLNIIQISQQPDHGTATIAADGQSIYYAPSSYLGSSAQYYYNGMLTLTYIIADSGGMISEGVVTLTVQPKATAPYANGEYWIYEQISLNVPLTTDSIVNNDLDGDDRYPTVVVDEMLTARIIDSGGRTGSAAVITGTSPSNGSVTATVSDNGKSLVFTPTEEGWYTFTYRIETQDRRSGLTSWQPSDTATAYIGVSETENVPPRLSGNTYYVNEDQYVSGEYFFVLTGLVHAMDIDSVEINSMFAYAKDDLLEYWSIEKVDGVFRLRFKQLPDKNGTVQLRWTVRQGGAVSGIGNVHLHIYSVNDSPEIEAIADRNVDRGDVETLDVAIHDVDDDHSSLRIIVNSNDDKIIPSDMITLAKKDGANDLYTLSFFAIDNYAVPQNHPITVTITASDGIALASKSFVVHVYPKNRAPEAGDPEQASLYEDGLGEFDVVSWGMDPDGDSLRIICDPETDTETGVFFKGDGAHTTDYGTALVDSKKILFSPAKDYYTGENEYIEIRYRLSDGVLESDIGIIRITILPVNDPPEILNLNNTYIMVEDTPRPIVFRVRDIDSAGLTKDSLSVVTDDAANDYITDAEIVSLVSAGDGSGEYIATLQMAFKEDAYHPLSSVYVNLTVTADDGDGGTVSKAFDLNITGANDAVRPKSGVEMPYIVTIDEDQKLVLNFDELFTDPEGQEITVFELSDATNGAVSGLADNKRIEFQPTLNYYNLNEEIPPDRIYEYASFTFTVSDPYGGSYSDEVLILIRPINDAPVAPDFSVSTSEDADFYIDPMPSGNLRVWDVDDTLDTLDLVSAVSQESLGEVTILEKENGALGGRYQLLYEPHPDASGTDTIRYTVRDPHGATATGTITVTIVSIVDDPRLAFDTSADGWDLSEVQEGAIVTWTMDEDVPTAFDFRMWQPEANANLSLVIAAYEWNGGATGGLVAHTAVVPRANISLLGSGEYRQVLLNPLLNQYGELMLEFTLTAGSSSITRYAHVVVRSVNDPPVISGAQHTIAEDAPITRTISATDVDTPQADINIRLPEESDLGPVYGFLSMDELQPKNGSVTLQKTGNAWSWQYTPKPKYFGSDAFYIIAEDEHGGKDFAKIEITITAVNDAPTAPDNLAMDKGIYKDGESVTLSFTPGADTLYETPRDELTYTIEVTYDGSSWEELTSDCNYTQAEIDVGTVFYTFEPMQGLNTDTLRARVKTNDTMIGGAAARSSDWAYTDFAILDNTAPAITALLSPPTDTNGDVTIRLTVNELNGIASVYAAQGAATYVDATTYYYTVETNGTYAFTATDNAGNTSATCEIPVGNIDKLKPSVASDTPPITADDGKYATDAISVTLTYEDAVATEQYKSSGVAQKKYAMVQSETAPEIGDAAWKDYGAAIPLNSKGTWYIHARVTDNAGNIDTFRFGPYVILNSAPEADDGTLDISEQGTGNSVTFDLNDYVSDADALDTRAFMITGSPDAAYGTLTPLGSGRYRFTHSGKGDGVFADTLTITYTVTDSSGESDGETITLRVAEVNDAPSIPTGLTLTAGLYNKDGDGIKLVWTASTDEETASGALVYEVQVQYPDGSWTTVGATASGETEYTCTVDANSAPDGAMQLRVRAKDAGIAGTGGSYPLAEKYSDYSNPVSLALDNTAPTYQATYTSGGSSYICGNDATTGIVIQFSFADVAGSGLKEMGYLLSAGVTAPAESGQYDKLTNGAGHTVAFQAIGEYYLHLYAIDNAGNVLTDTLGVFKVVNTPPRAISTVASVEEGGSVEIVLRGEDDDYMDAIADYEVDNTSFQYGSLVRALDELNQPIPGRYIYTHDGTDGPLTDSILFRVKDTHNVWSNAWATVNIIVNPVNDPPSITGLIDRYTLQEDTPYDVIFRISDPDNNISALNILIEVSDSAVIRKSGMALLRNDTGEITLTIRPEKDLNTADPVAITVTATDPDGNFETKTFTVTVDAVNDSPFASDRYYTVLPNCTVADIISATDADGDTLTYTLTTDAANGVFTEMSDFANTGRFEYKADAGGIGDYVVIEIKDEQLSTVAVTLSFTAGVQEEEDCGSIVREMVFAPSDVPEDVECRLTGNDPTFLSALDCRAEIDGTAVRITMNLAPHCFGEAALTLTLSSGGVTTEFELPIVICPRNDAPVTPERTHKIKISAPAFAIGSAVGKIIPDDSMDGIYDVEAYDFACDNYFDRPQNGALQLNVDGSYIYTPYAGFYGTDEFYITVTEIGNDRVNNPAPANLPAGILRTAFDDNLQIRVRVLVEVSKFEPIPDPDPDLTPDPGSSPNPGQSPDPNPSQSSAPNTSLKDNGKQSDLNRETMPEPEDDMASKNSPGGQFVVWLLLMALLVLFILLLFGGRIHITYRNQQYEAPNRKRPADAIKRNLFFRRVHFSDALRLDITNSRVDHLENTEIVIHFGWLYRRNFYEKNLSVLFEERVAEVIVPEKDEYMRDGVALSGNEFGSE